MRCSNTLAIPSPHIKNDWEFFSEYPFMLVGTQDQSERMEKAVFLFGAKMSKIKAKIQGVLGIGSDTVKGSDVGSTL